MVVHTGRPAQRARWMLGITSFLRTTSSQTSGMTSDKDFLLKSYWIFCGEIIFRVDMKDNKSLTHEASKIRVTVKGRVIAKGNIIFHYDLSLHHLFSSPLVLRSKGPIQWARAAHSAAARPKQVCIHFFEITGQNNPMFKIPFWLTASRNLWLKLSYGWLRVENGAEEFAARPKQDQWKYTTCNTHTHTHVKFVCVCVFVQMCSCVSWMIQSK